MRKNKIGLKFNLSLDNQKTRNPVLDHILEEKSQLRRRIMDSTKIETKKFTVKNDIRMWRIKMKALLTQQGLSEAIKLKPTTMTNKRITR